MKRAGKMFFSVEKNQKTSALALAQASVSGQRVRGLQQRTKVFLVLFLQKKNIFLLLLCLLIPLTHENALANPAPFVQVTGLVQHPGPVMLGGLKQVTVNATFSTMHGTQSHAWTGPLLAEVLSAVTLTDEPGKKTYWRHVILAEGQDGYTVAIALGEIDPKCEAKQVIVAVQEDGKPTPARLIVPKDNAFARGVQNLVTLEVR